MKKYGIFMIMLLLLSGCASKKYTIKIVNNNGELLSSFEVASGGNINNIDEPSMDGYIFVSLLKDGLIYDKSSPIYEDMTLEASFVKVPEIANNYTISFDFGDEVKTQTVKEGDKVIKPVDPKKNKYKFLGWYKDNELYDFDTEVYSDIYLTAKWDETWALITYELDGGDGIYSSELEKGKKLPVPNEPTKFGYHFVGWYLNDELYDFNTEVYSDMTLKAKWEAIQYARVSFDTDGGSKVNSMMIEVGSKLTNIEVPQKEGYRFLYWAMDGYEFDMNTVIDKNIRLVAIYEKID